MQQFNTALVLGGGGVRCMAHAGVFRALHDNGIKPDLVVGSSIGAVLGAVYAYKSDPMYAEGFAWSFSSNKTMQRLENSLNRGGENVFSKVFSTATFTVGLLHAFWRQGILSEEFVKRTFKNVLGKGILNSRKFLIEDTAIPFAALTTDYASAEAVAVTKGELPTFLYASAAFPGICKPVIHDRRVLMDGGIISVVPVMAAHLLGAKKVIAVDTEPKVTKSFFKNSIQAINMATDIRGHRLNIVEKDLADVTISPDIKGYKFYEFSKWELCKNAGYDATMGLMDQIKTVVDRPESDKSIKRQAYEPLYPFAVI